MTEVAPTLIDRRMAETWRAGDRARYYTGAERWIVYADESNTTFVVLATNSDRSWIGGDDTSYPAIEVAAAIERWSTTRAGLDKCPNFIDALRVEVLRVEAGGTRLEIIRAKYLLEAMLARVAIGQAEDMMPFSGCGHPLIIKDDDLWTGTIIVPWRAEDDS
jgi:hypothetical protein